MDSVAGMIVLATLLVFGGIAFWLTRRYWQRRVYQRQIAAIERRDAASQAYTIVQHAYAALFGTEYLATSEVTAWTTEHTEALQLAAEPGWCQSLPPNEIPAAHQTCQDLQNLDVTVPAHNARMIEARLQEEADAFDRVERYPLTDRQRRAILTNEDTTLVIAGAGTGKTSTIIGKVDYLLRRHLAAPDEILVLAYARPAAAELKERLVALGHPSTIEISTFHALGRRIVATAQGRHPTLTSFANDNDHALLPFLQSCVIDLWLDPPTRHLLTDFFSSLLDEPAVSVHDPRPDTQEFRTLTGQRLKSQQEVDIANWLTLHSITWEYERPYPIPTATTERRQYRPDFYLPAYDVYLEHFGIDRAGRTRADIDQARYHADMAWKRALHRTHGTTLIETFSYFAQEGGIAHHLDLLLRAQGIMPEPLPREQMQTLFRDSHLPASTLVNLLKQFLHLFKGNGCDRAGVAARARSPRDHAFLRIFDAVFERYRAELARTETIDFDDMINLARTALQAHTYHSRFRYVIVDEFQDISRNRLGLLLDLRAHVPHCRLFVVGDDWQAIYRFTGSDVSLITNLAAHVGAMARVDLDMAFRYPQELLNMSAAFVTANPSQLKKTLRAYQGNSGQPPIVLIFQEEASAGGLQRAIEQAHAEIQRHRTDKSRTVLLLGRYRRTCPQFFDQIQQHFAGSDLTLTYLTMHKSKGKEADNVIVLGLEMGNLGFPSTIPDDPVVNLVLTDAEAFAHAEERRLFYVTLTRARQRVYLIVPPTKVSPFIQELLTEPFAPYITTLGQPPVAYVCPVCSQATIQRRQEQSGVRWRCVEAPQCSGALPTCPTCRMGALQLTTTASGRGKQCTDCAYIAEICPRCQQGMLQERAGPYGPFVGCSEWQGGRGCCYTRSMPLAPTRAREDTQNTTNH